jgi:hypothetical protein
MEEFNHNNRRRKATGKVFTEAYNPQRIERLKSIIKDFHHQGKQKRYCVLVDGEMVVSINTDYRNFDNYKRYMLGHTQNIEVRMFFGESPNCNRHIFHTNAQGLNGAPQKDVQEQIKEALEKQRMETEISTLQKELRRKNKKLKQFKTLQAELDEKKIDIKELITKGLELYGQFNASKGGAFPSGTVQGTPQAEVEIEAEPETKADRHYADMKQQYSEKELEKALKTWEIFTAYPSLRKEFTELVNQKINNHGEA